MSNIPVFTVMEACNYDCNSTIDLPKISFGDDYPELNFFSMCGPEMK
jgi:hypothetical protein